MCFLVLMTLSAVTCKKDKECHLEIEIHNNSNQDVIVAILVPGSGNKCTMDGDLLPPGQIDKYSPLRGCIEKSLGDEYELIYIVDPNKWNNPNKYYSCDSIDYYNTVLKYYELNLDDLKALDFKVEYP